jgi:DNA polymerase-3 subunit epsilon
MTTAPELAPTTRPVPSTPPLGIGRQGTFDELGTPLRDVTFVVVDLETTGGTPEDGITEIGAVKVQGGRRLGEFQTLVNPGTPIPAFVQVLTGITDTMVGAAPRIDAALPAFLEFARGSVLVAHNAPFDVGFLKAACAATGRAWPGFSAVDTVKLARGVVTRDEAPNCKLATLAPLFGSPTRPNHRALSDARATVDVLHGLLERLGAMGVTTLEELLGFSAKVRPEQRRKRYLASGLPAEPGVYRFEDGRGEVLYVGTSGNIRDRVRTYFTASELRTRMAEMVGLAERVVPIVCAHKLEASVRELRLIAEHKPRYNRRSRFPERMVWLKLTEETFPRLSVVRQVRPDEAGYLGPFGSTRAAEDAMTAAHEAFRIRQCRQPLSVRRIVPACALAEMGRCNAPCEGRESPAEYAAHADGVRAAMESDAREIVARLRGRIEALSAAGRYEDAARHRDRLAAFTRTAARMQRLRGLNSCAELVAARPARDGGWDIAVVRHGRLAAATVAPHARAVLAAVQAAQATAATVVPGSGPLPAATAEETECILRWLEQSGTRLVALDGEWSSPLHGAGRWQAWLTAADAAARESSAEADRPRGPLPRRH